MHVQIANLSSVRTVKVQAAEFREILVGEATEQSWLMNKGTKETRSKHPAQNKSDLWKTDYAPRKNNQNIKRRLTERNACKMNQFPAHDSSDLSFGANANHFTI